MMQCLFLHPVNALYVRHLTKMLGVMRYHLQTIMTSSNGYQDIKVANNNTLTCKSMANLCIVAHPVAKRKHSKRFFNLFRLFKVFFNSTAVKSTIRKFSNTYLGCIDFICRCFCNVFIDSTTMVEVFNPCIGIKNVAFHKLLIVKVNFSVKRTTIIAMLHHLIILFAFSIVRPDTSQTQETGFTLFCRKFRRSFFRQHQFVGQPLTVGLRE